MTISAAKLLNALNRIIWGPPLLVFLLGTGCGLTLLMNGIPIKKLPWALKLLWTSGNASGTEKEISGLKALMMELAATIGTGNIVGVAGAMILGGPGAVFWMNIAAIFGLAVKLAESCLSVKYRRVGTDCLGGPMVTLRDAFPYKRMGKFLSVIYAFLALLCAVGMGNMVQNNSIAESVQTVFRIPKAFSGFLLFLMTLAVMSGGMHKISNICLYLVPAMGGIYLTGCLGILLMNAGNLADAVRGMATAAFCPRAACGGIFGITACSMRDSIRYGISRGIFSNEAGLGTGGISASAATEATPVRQGFISMTGVFFDTMLICTVTGLTIACSGVLPKFQSGKLYLSNGTRAAFDDMIGLMIGVFESAYGKAGGMILGICLTLFAYATVLGWAVQGERIFCFLFGDRLRILFRILFSVAGWIGSSCALEWVWGMSDLCNGLLAIPNLICLWVMGPEICRDVRAYFKEGVKEE